jgi:hypothetical protein
VDGLLGERRPARPAALAAQHRLLLEPLSDDVERGEGAPPGARRPGQGVEDAAWIGEFNAFNHANDADHPADWQDQLAEYMAYAKSNDIGWTIWEYGHGRNSGIVDKKGKPKTELIAGLQQGF